MATSVGVTPRPKSAPDEAVTREALKAFAAMDRDGDGELSRVEFRSGLGSLGMDEEFCQILFNIFDRDGDGTINKGEFITSMSVMLHPTDHEEQIGMAFDAYDSNKDGKLELAELQRVISALFSTMEKMGIRDENNDAVQTASELYNYMDTDGKGYVTRADYVRLATDNPEMLKKVGLGNLRPLRQPTRGDSSPSKLGSLYGVPQRRKGGRKRGTTVGFGHDNWELVVQMMLAIRLSVARARQTGVEVERRFTNSKSASAGKTIAQSKVSVDTAAAAKPQSTLSEAGSSAEAGAAPPPLTLSESSQSPGMELSKQSRSDAAFALEPEHFAERWRTTIPGYSNGKDATIGFKDYAPLVFRRIRQMCGISDSEYMLSLGPEQILGELLLGTMGSLSELFSEGKSGSFFYFSNDGRYLIKTIPHRELLSLMQILPQYVQHVEGHRFTLLPRFMGAHRLKLPSRRKKVHFMVITNVFSTPRIIHHRYDLKGSTFGRTAGSATLDEFPDMVRKDLDVKQPFKLRQSAREALLAQLHHDLAFLRASAFLDYSLLVGVHFPGRDVDVDVEMVGVELSEPKRAQGASPRGAAHGKGSIAPSPGGAADAGGSPNVVHTRRHATRGPIGRERHGLPPWVNYADWAMDSPQGEGEEPALFFIGVIDILTNWTCAKSLENIVKTAMHPHKPNAHSCVPPVRYADRFQQALSRWLA